MRKSWLVNSSKLWLNNQDQELWWRISLKTFSKPNISLETAKHQTMSSFSIVNKIFARLEWLDLEKNIQAIVHQWNLEKNWRNSILIPKHLCLILSHQVSSLRSKLIKHSSRRCVLWTNVLSHVSSTSDKELLPQPMSLEKRWLKSLEIMDTWTLMLFLSKKMKLRERPQLANKCFLQPLLARKITPEMVVKMLKKIVYSGNPQCSKFILTSFPEVIEDAKAFELCWYMLCCTKLIWKLRISRMLTFKLHPRNLLHLLWTWVWIDEKACINLVLRSSTPWRIELFQVWNELSSPSVCEY